MARKHNFVSSWTDSFNYEDLIDSEEEFIINFSFSNEVSLIGKSYNATLDKNNLLDFLSIILYQVEEPTIPPNIKKANKHTYITFF